MAENHPTDADCEGIRQMVKDGKRFRQICEAFSELPAQTVLDIAYPRRDPQMDPSIRLLRAILRQR